MMLCCILQTIAHDNLRFKYMQTLTVAWRYILTTPTVGLTQNQLTRYQRLFAVMYSDDTFGTCAIKIIPRIRSISASKFIPRDEACYTAYVKIGFIIMPVSCWVKTRTYANRGACARGIPHFAYCRCIVCNRNACNLCMDAYIRECPQPLHHSMW